MTNKLHAGEKHETDAICQGRAEWTGGECRFENYTPDKKIDGKFNTLIPPDYRFSRKPRVITDILVPVIVEYSHDIDFRQFSRPPPPGGSTLSL